MNSKSKTAVIFALILAGFTATPQNVYAISGVHNGYPRYQQMHVYRPVAKPKPAISLRVAAMNSALTQVGASYVWGAAGGYYNGYDCSGLVYWSYRQHGKTISRTTGGQYAYSHHINWRYRTPGDLVFIRYGTSTPYHVGIYVGYWSGKSWMVNANSGSYRGRKVVVAPISEYLGGGANAAYGRY